VRIKALPPSQSKQEKMIGVITIQRGKDSWNQSPQTSGSSTPPLTRAPHTRARLHAHYHRPTPLCSAPTAAIIAGNTRPPSPCLTRCRVAPTPSPPLRNRTPTLAYKPPSSLSSHPIPDKISSAQSQAIPFSTPSPLRSQCLVILGLKTVVHGS
jgi:hypothetical protein